MTAHDAVWSFTRSSTRRPTTPTRSSSSTSRTARPSTPGTAQAEDLGLKAVDDWTLEITLEGPRANFPQKLAYTACVFAHRASVEEHGDQWALGGDIPLVSNGPFKLDEWEQGVRCVMSPNPNYWNAENIRITRLVDPIIPGDQSVLAFESGRGEQRLDWTPVGAADLARFQGDPELAPLLKEFVYPGSWFLLPSNGQPPFDQLEVRQAVSHAIDRDRLVTVTNGLVIPSQVMVPIGVYGYFDDPDISEIQKFDPALAMAALEGTEFAGGTNWPEITMLMRSDEGQLNSNLMANDIVAQLKENLGMDIKIEELPEATFRPTLYENKAQIVWIRWWMDYPDADNNYYDMFYGKKPQGSKRQAWANDEFDEIIVSAKAELDPEKRLDLYKQAERIIQEDVGYIPDRLPPRHERLQAVGEGRAGQRSRIHRPRREHLRAQHHRDRDRGAARRVVDAATPSPARAGSRSHSCGPGRQTGRPGPCSAVAARLPRLATARTKPLPEWILPPGPPSDDDTGRAGREQERNRTTWRRSRVFIRRICGGTASGGAGTRRRSTSPSSAGRRSARSSRGSAPTGTPSTASSTSFACASTWNGSNARCGWSAWT